MELTENEKKLIQFLRDTNEPPANIMLWYISGLEASRDKLDADNYRVKIDNQRIEKATQSMRSMY